MLNCSSEVTQSCDFYQVLWLVVSNVEQIQLYLQSLCQTVITQFSGRCQIKIHLQDLSFIAHARAQSEGLKAFTWLVESQEFVNRNKGFNNEQYKKSFI